MAVFGIGAVTRLRRLIGAATLLFLFFLPLHVHLSLSPQLSSHCSCHHGARAQFVVSENPPAVVPAAQFGVLLEPQICDWSSAATRCQYVRGPPLSPAV